MARPHRRRDQGQDRGRRHRPDRVRQGSRRHRALARVPGGLAGARRRGHRPGRGRRHRVVHDGAEPRGRRRPQRRPRRRHLVLAGRLRRRRGLRGRRAGRDGGRDRSVHDRGRVAGPQAGRSDEPAVGAGAGAPRRQQPVEPSVRRAPARRRDRDAHPPLHARVRRHARSPRERRARVPQARGPQSRLDDGPQADDPRRLHERALDLGTAVPVRQLPRDRRRARGRGHVGGTGPRPRSSRPRTSIRSRRACRRSTRR